MLNSEVKLTMADYQMIIDGRAQAEKDAAALRVELAAARMADPTDTITKVTAFARDAMIVARFAVSNLPPETIKSWPHEVLKRVAETMNVLPDFSTNDRDLALDLIAFAKDCEQYELRRRGLIHDTTLDTPRASLSD
jgi:hypothetical protein